MKPRFEIGDNLAYVLMYIAMILFFIALAITESKAQTVTLPTWIIDSAIYEIRKGRSCDSLNILNERIIKSQGTQLLNYGRTLKLTESKYTTLEKLLENQKESQNILTKQFALDISKEKRKTKRWRRIGIIQAVVIIAIILTPK